MAEVRVPYLGQDDISVLKEMVAWWRHQPGNLRGRPDVTENDHQAPEVYVARTPAGGIDAKTGSTPGYADCDIYRTIIESGSPTLVQAGSGLSKRVYNHSSSAVAGSTDIAVARDKYGQWYALVSGSGSSPAEPLTVYDIFQTTTANDSLTQVDDVTRISFRQDMGLKVSRVTYNLTGATNASPIVVTVDLGTEISGFIDGSIVTITGVLGNTAANGTWSLAAVSDTEFELYDPDTLDPSVGNGSYTSGGTITMVGEARISQRSAAADQAGCVDLVADQYLGSGRKALDGVRIPATPASLSNTDALLTTDTTYEEANPPSLVRLKPISNAYGCAFVIENGFICWPESTSLSLGDGYIMETGTYDPGSPYVAWEISYITALNVSQSMLRAFGSSSPGSYTLSTSGSIIVYTPGYFNAGTGFAVGPSGTEGVTGNFTADGSYIDFQGGIIVGGGGGGYAV